MFNRPHQWALCMGFSAFAALALVSTWPGAVQATPIGDAFQQFNDSDTDETLGYNPLNDTKRPPHKSLFPNLTPEINEPHPFPDYIKNFARGEDFPKYYRELLSLPPVDKVQSKIFNQQAFVKTRNIGVAGFENKTTGLFKDENAGYVVASQVFQELQRYGQFRVIPPAKGREDARLKITKSRPAPSSGMPKKEVLLTELPYADEHVDAVLIGAVTKYMDHYIDNRGKLKESLSSGVEFGAFLVSKTTGEVIWGARFVGSQTPNLRNFFAGGQTHWLNKEELSRSAMKNVLREFRKISGAEQKISKNP